MNTKLQTNLFVIACYCFTASSYAQQAVWLNIFIHGTSRPYISISDIIKVGKDRIENSRYETVTSNIRDTSSLHTSQAIQQQGLHKVNIQKSLHNSAALLCSLYDQVQKEVGKDGHEKQLYYTFGWNGLLSLRARRDASFELFDVLNSKFNSLSAKGYKPKIRIIGYSHGGTIGLYLAEIAKQRKNKASFHVDELILIGTPIQEDTDFLTRDPIFKKIYNIYSQGDLVQPADIISTPFNITGERKFISRKGFTVPAKVIQIEIKLIRKKLSIKNTCDCHDRIIDRIDKLNPGHIELWHFSWTSSWYRQHLPIKPFPACLFIPFYQKAIPAKETGEFEIVLIPEDSMAFVHKKCTTRRVPFLSKKFMSNLKEQAQVFQATVNQKKQKLIFEKAKKQGKKCFRKSSPRINSVINQQRIDQSCGL